MNISIPNSSHGHNAPPETYWDVMKLVRITEFYVEYQSREDKHPGEDENTEYYDLPATCLQSEH